MKLLLFVLAISVSPVCQAGDETPEIELPVMKLTGSSSDVLLDDGTVPPRLLRAQPTEPGASAAQALGQSLGISVTDYGKPGTLSQVRGTGRGAEEVNVQTLGIPLNPPQGGGFDFTSFPPFFWSRSSYLPTTGPGAYDPRTNAGVVSLVPWSADAIESDRSGSRFQQVFVSSGIRQTSVGLERGRTFGILAGYSDGKVTGPTGSVSVRPWTRPHSTLKLHLLGTSVRGHSPGSRTFPSPRATTLYQRLTPVAQWSVQPDEKSKWFTSFFYDWNRIRYEDPDQPTYASNDRARQWGSESVLQTRSTKLGGGIRRASLDRADFAAPAEWVGHLAAANGFEMEKVTLTPEARLSGLSRMGVYPGGSVALRSEKDGRVLYSKLGYQPRFPSMIDRYYSSAAAIPNPALRPEKDVTGLLGAEWSLARWSFATEALHQHRFNVLVLQSLPGYRYKVQNSNRAWIQSIRQRIDWDATPRLKLSGTLTWSRSRIIASGTDFPLQPEWLSVGQAAYAPFSQPEAGSVGFSVRGHSSQAMDSTGGRLGGFTVFDLTASYRIAHWDESADTGLFVDARLENLFDRQYEAVYRDYPAEGRVLSAGVTGRL